jgi:hypothetical protein
MKPILTLNLFLIVTVCAGCADNRKETEQAKADAAAKARAEAAKKEMETLPKVFRSRDIFEKNEAEKAEPKKADVTAEKKP